MKRNFAEYDREKKIRRVSKGTDKSSKHRKSIYNMLTDDEEDLVIESETEDSDVKYNYSIQSNVNYTKQR